MAVTAHKFLNITPSDDNDIDRDPTHDFPDAVYVGTAGTAVVVGKDGSTGNFVMQAGGIIPGGVKRILATGTTAGDFVGLYL